MTKLILSNTQAQLSKLQKAVNALSLAVTVIMLIHFVALALMIEIIYFLFFVGVVYLAVIAYSITLSVLMLKRPASQKYSVLIVALTLPVLALLFCATGGAALASGGSGHGGAGVIVLSRGHLEIFIIISFLAVAAAVLCQFALNLAVCIKYKGSCKNPPSD